MDNWVELSVKDTGIGMKKEMVENLFARLPHHYHEFIL